jgi:DNA-binding beta-propeller fold protein YncE
LVRPAQRGKGQVVYRRETRNGSHTHGERGRLHSETNAEREPDAPTITAGLNAPDGVAVDAAGRIYVANGGRNTITTYNPNGTQTALTITTGVDGPGKMALR